MPVRFSSSDSSQSDARIEIIPLIDIMFFLLAAFMLVSIGMTQSKSLPVRLPTSSTGRTNVSEAPIIITVVRSGATFLGNAPVGSAELRQRLSESQRTNHALKILIRGDADTRHADMIRVLDSVRATGIERVAFDVQETPPPASPSTP